MTAERGWCFKKSLNVIDIYLLTYKWVEEGGGGLAIDIVSFPSRAARSHLPISHSFTDVIGNNDIIHLDFFILRKYELIEWFELRMARHLVVVSGGCEERA